jgi:phytoene dehydrogenase-like protein
MTAGPSGQYDVVLIGSGINSLVCAALLDRKSVV